jgi:hypothetical protein
MLLALCCAKSQLTYRPAIEARLARAGAQQEFLHQSSPQAEWPANFCGSSAASVGTSSSSEVESVTLEIKPVNVFFGHHKAATSWIVKILSDLGHLNGYRVATVDTTADLRHALASDPQQLRRAFIAFRNADPTELPALQPLRGFHIIRDPRDIAVSSYFSHLHSHPTDNWPELAEHKQRLSRLDLNDGLLCDMEFCRDLPTRGQNIEPYRCMAEWDYTRSDVLEIRYEDLINSPYETVIGAFAFLNLLAPDELGAASLARHLRQIVARRLLPATRARFPRLYSWNVLAAVYDNRYETKASGRKQGTEDPQSHYRKGVAGDWRNYFQTQHHQRFQELYGDILVRLAYETAQ